MCFQRNSSDWIAVRLVGLSYCVHCTAKLCLIAPRTRFILLLCPMLTVLAWMTPHRILFVSTNRDTAVPQVVCILEISRNCREVSGFPQLLHVCLRAAGIAPFFKGCHSDLAKVLCWGQLHTGWSERTMIVSSPETWKDVACSVVRVKYPAFPGWCMLKIQQQINTSRSVTVFLYGGQDHLWLTSACTRAGIRASFRCCCGTCFPSILGQITEPHLLPWKLNTLTSEHCKEYSEQLKTFSDGFISVKAVGRATGLLLWGQ